jgi:hypothetical protein
MSKAKPERRVTFEHPFPAQIMAIDGTWRRACSLKDVSETGAMLEIQSSVEGLSLKEFFLLLSSTGLAYRRCELGGVNGAEIEVVFLRRKSKVKTSPKTEPSTLV